MIHQYLKKSYDGDMEARAQMHDAQCLAGMAFSNALLGIVHSMAHKTGAAYSEGILFMAQQRDVPAQSDPFYSKNTQAAERYANIARFIHLPGNTTAELIDALIEELREMNRQLNIPLGIKNYGQGGVLADTSIIDENEFNGSIAEVAKNANCRCMHGL